jgi:hypothetical protein
MFLSRMRSVFARLLTPRKPDRRETCRHARLSLEGMEERMTPAGFPNGGFPAPAALFDHLAARAGAPASFPKAATLPALHNPRLLAAVNRLNQLQQQMKQQQRSLPQLPQLPQTNGNGTTTNGTSRTLPRPPFDRLRELVNRLPAGDAARLLAKVDQMEARFDALVARMRR